jgi:hypothetical protein
MSITPTGSSAETSKELFEQFLRDPFRHPQLPNVAYAGYRSGRCPPADGVMVADVRELGARGDGIADDTPAFDAALNLARGKGGVVRVPAGEYRVERVLRLDRDGIVLRGEGTERTRIRFQFSLHDLHGPHPIGTSQGWSWMGGLVWVGPADALENDRIDPDVAEEWPVSEPITMVDGEADIGERKVRVRDSSGLRPGDWVLMTWTDPDDRSLLKHIAGHPSMEAADWGVLAGVTWRWPVQIERVGADDAGGGYVMLARPLRLEIRAAWQVCLRPVGPMVRECGIESMSIEFPRHVVTRHLQDRGFNAIYLNRAADCWVRDVRIVNADNGFILSSAANTTATGLSIVGQPSHHATALRCFSNDNLLERFTIESRPMHGINTEGMGSGNVWRDGVMNGGTFDSHRGMSFDSVRTNITIAASGRPGGAGHAGPFLGRRVVHWNVRIRGGSTEWIFCPEYHPSGALVGIQGGTQHVTAKPFGMPPGEKGCLILDVGVAPTPVDLHDAQKTPN